MGVVKSGKSRETTPKLYQDGSVSSSKELLQRSTSSLLDNSSSGGDGTMNRSYNNRPSAICQLVTSVLCCTLLLFAVILFNHIYTKHQQVDALNQYYDTQIKEQQDKILLLQTKQQVYFDRLKIVEDTLKRNTINTNKVRIYIFACLLIYS